MPNSTFPPAIRFDFPIANYGIALGNGTLTLQMWGDETLCVTIARANPKNESENFIENALGADELLEKLALWRPQNHPANSAILELDFGGVARPFAAILGADGILQVELSDGRAFTIECAMDEELAWIDGISGATWELRSAPQSGDNCAPLEIQIDDGHGLVWEFDAQKSLVTMVRERDDFLFIATARGETEDAARAAVSRARCKPDINPIYYWKQFWRSAPRVVWPNAGLQRKWDIALFQQAQAHSTSDKMVDFIAAFTSLLVQEQSDGIHVTPSISPNWREFSFDNIRCEGAFLVGASVVGGAVIEVRVKSENGGNLRLRAGANNLIEREMSAGEDWIWRA